MKNKEKRWSLLGTKENMMDIKIQNHVISLPKKLE